MQRTTLLLALFKFSLGSMFLLPIRCKKRVIVKDTDSQKARSSKRKRQIVSAASARVRER